MSRQLPILEKTKTKTDKLEIGNHFPSTRSAKYLIYKKFSANSQNSCIRVRHDITDLYSQHARGRRITTNLKSA